MSWFSDFAGSYVKGLGDVYSTAVRLGSGRNDVADWIQQEFGGKQDLRGTQIESVLSGFPIVGDLLRGVNGVQSMEDLYNRTGKTAAYAANQNLGSAGIGYGVTGAAKVASGKSDLYDYYAGEPDGMEESYKYGMIG